MELFAGAARVSRLGKALGLHAGALDKALCKGNNRDVTNCMDINTDAGFLLLIYIITHNGSFWPMMYQGAIDSCSGPAVI